MQMKTISIVKSASKKLAQNAVVLHCALVCARFFLKHTLVSNAGGSSMTLPDFCNQLTLFRDAAREGAGGAAAPPDFGR